jgi:hypothetical protein
MTNGWIERTEARCPVADDILVEVRYANTGVSIGEARTFAWQARGSGMVVAYRVLDEAPKTVDWIEFGGGGSPVRWGTAVEVRLRDGCVKQHSASAFSWVWAGKDSDIVAYRVLEEHLKEADGWVKCGGGSCPLEQVDEIEVRLCDGCLERRFAGGFRWSREDRNSNRNPPPSGAGEAQVRNFDTGATRSPDSERIDPEGFLSPIVIERFCEYMAKHRRQPDGALRASDNWQKGLPLETYAKGLQRHQLHAWTRHRGFEVRDPQAAESIEEDLCAILFNASGYLFELLKDKRRETVALDLKGLR